MPQQKQYTPSTVYWTPGGRSAALERLRSGKPWDLVVVGGGITGAGIYREAVARGLKTLLVEQRDFAWGTSSRSSKMVHGGLRYLGSGQFGLANHSVKERQKLMTELPGLVDTLPFMMGHYKGGFPGPWIFDKLLAIYDFMAGRRYRRFFKRGILDFLIPGLKTQSLNGVTQFADAVTDDARLVLRVIEEGNYEGGIALNYLRAERLIKDDQGQVKGLVVTEQSGLGHEDANEEFEIKAEAVVNATGAWSDELRALLGAKRSIRPLRGSHLVIPQWRMPVAYSVSFFHPIDKRPVFVFPWEGVTVIGTTDLDHQGDSHSESSISAQEVSYLLEAANTQFPDIALTSRDVTATWSGVRPVVSDDPTQALKPSDEKREHVIWDDSGLISVAGGKLTTYRHIALEVLRKASPYLSKSESEFEVSTCFKTLANESHPLFHGDQLRRLQGRYASGLERLTRLVIEQPELAEAIHTTDTLYAELVLACEGQGVEHLDDLLLRRTRIGLLLENGGRQQLPKIKQYCQSVLEWDDARWAREEQRYLDIIELHYALPESMKSGVDSDAQGVRSDAKSELIGGRHVA